MPGIDEKTLLKLQQGGWDSAMIGYRLDYAAAESVLRYVKPLLGQERAHPHFLPTQKSGRWSTTNPPLANFSAECISPACTQRGVVHIARGNAECWSLRDVVVPDPGYYFLKWDLDAIEAKLAAAYSGDDEDLQCFAQGLDIHTRTVCKVFGLATPPDLKDPHKAESCRAWRQQVGWGGKDDKRRVAAKTARYSMAYGSDEMAILQAKDVDKMGLTRDELIEAARAYLKSKPKLIAFKRRVWQQIMETHETRTALGRRRRLFVTDQEYATFKRTGRPGPSCREGLNHMFQGWVADAMNLTLVAVKQRFPQARFGYQTHDGATWVVPEDVEMFPTIREIVERKWQIGESEITSTASWLRVNSDGTHREL